jgi:hypothetical protein
MAAVRTVKLPSPGPNDQGATPPKTWEQEEIKQDAYPGMLDASDPRELSSKGPPNLETQQDYPGSGVPGEPWTSAPAPPPRRRRRDA